MSWSISKIGHANKLAETAKELFEKIGGCPAGSAEEAAKNAVGAIVQSLCASIDPPNAVIRVDAMGSALNTPDGKAK